MKRSDGRRADQLRRIRVRKNYIKNAQGSCLIEFGDTHVVCTATVEENVPPFLRNSGAGWVTAEYGMLPASCGQRVRRNQSSGRTYEIQRLIGRSLRAVTDMTGLGERTVKIDCDVLQADGGTRTASITGAFIALILALQKTRRAGVIEEIPVTDYVAAVSVGVCEGKVLLDLKYDEDSQAEVDMNVVMLGGGGFVEVQGTAEGAPFSRARMDKMLDLARRGIRELIAIQKNVVKF